VGVSLCPQRFVFIVFVVRSARAVPNKALALSLSLARPLALAPPPPLSAPPPLTPSHRPETPCSLSISLSGIEPDALEYLDTHKSVRASKQTQTQIARARARARTHTHVPVEASL
jgi:hypothetical protein